MAETYAGICMLCGRNLGYVIEGTFITSPGGVRPERHGRHLRCGYCQGAIIFEPDTTLPRDWVAEQRREAVASDQPRRAYRRRAM